MCVVSISVCGSVSVCSECVKGERDRKLRTKEETVVLEERMKDASSHLLQPHTTAN